jgi:hypothetical protein
MKKETFKCCICDTLILNSHGNNPWPVKDHGKCCDTCNSNTVIPMRIAWYTTG